MRKEHIKDLRKIIKAFEKMTASLEEIIEEAEEPIEGTEEESLVGRKFILTEEGLFFTSGTTEGNVYIVEKCYTYFGEMSVEFKNDEGDVQTVFINKHIILLNDNK